MPNLIGNLLFEHLDQFQAYTGAQPEMFQGSGGFVKLGHSDKHFVKNSRKKDPARKNFEVLSLTYS